MILCIFVACKEWLVKQLVAQRLSREDLVIGVSHKESDRERDQVTVIVIDSLNRKIFSRTMN